MATSVKKVEAVENQNLKFQEVMVRRMSVLKNKDGYTVSKFEVLKVQRPVVKITRQEADTVNLGSMADIRNHIFCLYRLPDDPREFDHVHYDFGKNGKSEN